MNIMLDTGTIWSLPQALSVLFSGVTMVGVLGAVWWLATTFATMKAQLLAVADTPSRIAVLEREFAVMRNDIQALWNAFRKECDELHQMPSAFADFLEELDKRRPTEPAEARRISP